MDRPVSPSGAAPAAAFGIRLTEFHDSRRARSLPLKLYLPERARPRGLILFSHGLGGTRESGAEWLAHWAGAGFAALAVQHPGSDASLLHNNSPLALRRAFQAAMNPAELACRAADIRFVLARLGHDPHLPEALDAAIPIGLAGHSFGAVTVQLIAGERRAGHAPEALDARVKAALAFSPSARNPHADAGLEHRFGAIQLPFFGITGSRDDGMGLSDISAANREQPYRHMPADGTKYLLVFANGNHLDFSGEGARGEGALLRLPRTPPVFRANLLAASTAFWDAHLAGDAAAQAWLKNTFPAQLRPDDRFEHK